MVITEEETLSQDVALKEDVLGIDEVVITATKTKENRKDAPVLVSVTTNRELANVKAHTLMEGLVFQPRVTHRSKLPELWYFSSAHQWVRGCLFANPH